MTRFIRIVIGSSLALALIVGIWMNTDSVSSQTDKEETSPIVSFSDDRPERPVTIGDLRSRRNSKYDDWGWVRNSPSSEVQNVLLNTHWQIGLSTLPTAKSDLIVSASVKSSEAFLSTDRTGVYSEFSLAIAKILKNNKLRPIDTENTTTALRAGGRVKYPAGNIVKYSIRGQEMPRVGGSYIFFLTYDKGIETYSILTAYEVRSDDQIKALDGRNGDEKAGWSFTKKDNLTREHFIQEIELLILADVETQKEISKP